MREKVSVVGVPPWDEVNRVTILAPDITVAVLDGRQPKGLKLAEVLRDVPLDWQQQRAAFGFSTTTPPPAAT